MKKVFLNKDLLADLEFDTNSSIILYNYKKNKIKTIINFVNKDRLAYITYIKI